MRPELHEALTELLDYLERSAHSDHGALQRSMQVRALFQKEPPPRLAPMRQPGDAPRVHGHPSIYTAPDMWHRVQGTLRIRAQLKQPAAYAHYYDRHRVSVNREMVLLEVGPGDPVYELVRSVASGFGITKTTTPFAQPPAEKK